jgi:DNA-binding SARP family transcriptional activator
MTSSGDPGLRIDVLGSLVVLVAGKPVPVTAGRLRAMVAGLALTAGDDVSIDRLVDMVFGGRQPANVRRAVQLYVLRLRRLLGHHVIHTVPGGYRLEIDPDRVDALRFDRMLDAAAAAGDAASERGQLRQALALWRGVPFDGVRCAWLEEVESPRLQERYMTALERRIELDLAAGGAADLVAELRALTGSHPLRERLWELLIMALYRSGRRAEALEVYGRLYHLLDSEIGTEPSRSIRDLQRMMLNADSMNVGQHWPTNAKVGSRFRSTGPT